MTTAEMEVYEARELAPRTLFGTEDPGEVVLRATAAAKPLAEVIEKQQLFTNISGRKHVRVEGWCLLGSMIGVFPVLDGEPEQIVVDGQTGWRATVKAVTRDGAVVGRASALCLRSESTWAKRDDYALMSMAQTRATSKALRQPLGFVMQLAGFSATPEEEMPVSDTFEKPPVVDPAGVPFPDERPVFDGEEPVAEGQFEIPASAKDGPEQPRTDRQGKTIFALYKALEKKDARFTVAYLKAQCEASYGSADDRKLSESQAEAWILHLKELEAA